MATITYMYATGDGIERIDYTAFQIIIWLSAGVPLPFLLLRLFVRMRIFKKWYIDDYLVTLAWLLLLTFSIIWQMFAKDLYAVVDALSEGITDSFTDIIYHVGRFQMASTASYVLQALCLWSVKASFLAFFRKLGNNVPHQRPIWWGAVLFNIASFGIWVGTVIWKCVAVPVDVAIATCNNSTVAAFSQASIEVETAFDVLSDVAILIIPAALLWKSQIHLKKKLALLGIFSLTLFVMIASIIRVVVTTDGSENDDLTWMSTWAGIEMGVAIIVACLASFRVLFTTRTRSLRSPGYKDYTPQDPDSLERRGLARFGLAASSTNASSPEPSRKAGNRRTLYPLDSFLSQTDTCTDAKISAEWGEKYERGLKDLEALERRPLDGVLIRNSITVQHEPAPTPAPAEEQRSWLDLR